MKSNPIEWTVSVIAMSTPTIREWWSTLCTGSVGGRAVPEAQASLQSPVSYLVLALTIVATRRVCDPNYPMLGKSIECPFELSGYGHIPKWVPLHVIKPLLQNSVALVAISIKWLI